MFKRILSGKLFRFILTASAIAVISNALVFSIIKLLSCSQIPRHGTELSGIGNVPSFLTQIYISVSVLFAFFAAIASIRFFDSRFTAKKTIAKNIIIYFSALSATVLLSLIFFSFSALFDLIFAKSLPCYANIRFYEIILSAIGTIPAIMMIIASELFFYNISSNKYIRSFLQIPFTVFLLFFSGGFFSIFNLSDAVREISEIQPFGVCVSYYSRMLTEYRPYILFSELILYAIIFFALALIADKCRQKSAHTVKKKTALAVLIILTLFITVCGGALLSHETAITKVACVFDCEDAKNEKIIETINSNANIYCIESGLKASAKIKLCYGNCDAVYIFEDGENTAVFQRENTPLLDSAYKTITNAEQNSEINCIILTYYILVALSLCLSVLIVSSSNKYSK